MLLNVVFKSESMVRPKKTSQGKTVYVNGDVLPVVEAVLAGKSVGGIYAIKNSKCGRVYVGSTKDFHSRWKSHKSSLMRGDHPNKKLQQAWNDHGSKSFTFVVLEVVDNIALLVERENEWMSSFGSFNPDAGYNTGEAKIRAEGVPEGVTSVSQALWLSDFNAEVFSRMDVKERGGVFAAGLELKTMGYLPFYLAINALDGRPSIEKRDGKYCLEVWVKGEKTLYEGYSQASVLLDAIRTMTEGHVMESFVRRTSN